MTDTHTHMHNYTRGLARRDTVPGALTVRQVAAAYNFPTDRFTGAGFTGGIVELGGSVDQASLDQFFAGLGLATPSVIAVAVDGGQIASDGPDGADGEVQLDIEVAGGVAPGAAFQVFFGPNTEAGFLAAYEQAAAKCDVVMISWGQAENQWSPNAIEAFDAAFLAARKNGVITLVASGDSGADDQTGAPVTDFPAASPNVIACGGTRLTVNAAGRRSGETAWSDGPSSASGGGVSKVFAGRQVPDIAGNADPNTGYQVIVDGTPYVIGGTSAVAPLYGGLMLLLCEAVGGRLGSKVDLMNTLLTNLGVLFDVTAGDNGAYRAGPGRDDVTGLGVIDGDKLLAVLTDDIADPAPLGGGDGAFQLSSVLASRVAHAAARAGLTPDQWVERRLASYFELS